MHDAGYHKVPIYRVGGMYLTYLVCIMYGYRIYDVYLTRRTGSSEI